MTIRFRVLPVMAVSRLVPDRVERGSRSQPRLVADRRPTELVDLVNKMRPGIWS